MATTLLSQSGTRVCGLGGGAAGKPHSTTVPLLRNAREWPFPPATATASFNPNGTSGPPKLTTVPALGQTKVCAPTVRVATVLVTEPYALAMTTVYAPAS